jgi:hypothetical protein
MNTLRVPTEVERFSIIGFLVYCLIFVFLVPYLLLRNSQYQLLAAYFPNLDNLATALGYMGGPPVLMPGEFWRYLRETCEESVYEFISISLIHYVALLGLTFVISHYTYKYKSVSRGWSIAFFMLFITYIIPGNVIALLQDKFGNSLNTYINSGTLPHYTLVTLLGVLGVSGFIMIEEKLIHKYSDDLAIFIRYFAKLFGITLN